MINNSKRSLELILLIPKGWLLVISVLVHSVMTGSMFPFMMHFLVDSIGMKKNVTFDDRITFCFGRQYVSYKDDYILYFIIIYI
jgi:hypothetical protein